MASNKFRLSKLAFLSIVLFFFFQVYFSTNAFNALNSTIRDICKSVRALLPPLSMLMLIGAGVVYVGGQFTGAETRSRANVWATNLLIGALIGLLIAAVAPYALNALGEVALRGTSTAGSTVVSGSC